jgi:hypothetical protein
VRVVSHEVVTPSIGVDVPVDVGVVELSINVAAVNISSVHVAPVEISCVHVPPVDVASIDVTGRSISDRRPRMPSTASRDVGLRYCQPHAARNQNCQNYNNLAHVHFSFSKDLFLPIYNTLRLQFVAWVSGCDILEFLEKALLQDVFHPMGRGLASLLHFDSSLGEDARRPRLVSSAI